MTLADPKNDVIANIVAAYAARPDVTPDNIVELVAKLKQELSPEPGTPAVAPAAALDKPTPALPLDQAVTHGKIYCLCCGKGFKMIKRHLGVEHGLSEAQYRTLFDLPDDMPLVAPAYSEKKAAYAKRVGLGRYQRDAGDTAGDAAGDDSTDKATDKATDKSTAHQAFVD